LFQHAENILPGVQYWVLVIQLSISAQPMLINALRVILKKILAKFNHQGGEKLLTFFKILGVMIYFKTVNLTKTSTCQKHQPEPFDHFRFGLTFWQGDFSGLDHFSKNLFKAWSWSSITDG